MEQTEKISGKISRVHFCNAESPWMAGVITLSDQDAERAGRSSTGFSGKVSGAVGDKIELVGRWVMHPKFGEQFEAETGVVKMDETPDAMVGFLATHKDFKGLGPARSRKIVEAALNLSTTGDFAQALLDYPEEIATRAKVPVDLVLSASEKWGKNRDRFAALAALVDQGWSGAQAQRIVDELGNGAASLVKADPYQLIGLIPRFGFRTVDAVALRIGIKKTSLLRLHAGVAFVLASTAENGDTWTEREALVATSIEELHPDTIDAEDLIRSVIDELIAIGAILVSTSPTGTEIVADSHIAAVEFLVFEELLEGLNDESLGSLLGNETEKLVENLNDDQLAAVRGFSSRRFSLISGGAGVGKTYTMNAICNIANANGLKVALCAPTGKAARKLSHATNRTASTIHRLLEPFMDSGGSFSFKRNAANPIEADLVIIDEVSMVDVILMRSLLVALPEGCRLLLVGDHHQIPSVGAGAILRDLLRSHGSASEAVHVLNKVVRQAGELAINTTAILNGKVSKGSSPAWAVQFTERGHEEGAAAIAATLVDALVTSPEPLEPFGRLLDLAWDVQVLAPMRKGPMGTYALNVHLQRLRQRLLGNAPPPPTSPNSPPKPLVGDRVLWTKNDYELGLFNGTQAIVVNIAKGGEMELFTEDGREVKIPGAKRSNVEVAYAMTIHKSQGSEWPCVILVISSAHWIMRDRNLLYTGASRASESLTILGDNTGIMGFASEKKSAGRRTFGAFMVHGWRHSTSSSTPTA